MKRYICLTAVAAVLAATAGLARSQGTSAKVYKPSADKMVVASGGEIEVESGGTLTIDGTLAGDYGIDTSKVTSGVFADARIPSLDTSKVTTGVFDSARIPATLDTSKIASGVFADARIPSLDTSKITTGVFAAARIPVLDTTKLDTVTAPGIGTLLCYTDDGKVGKVTAAVESGGMDTGKVTTCAAF